MSFSLKNLKEMLDGTYQEPSMPQKQTLPDIFWGEKKEELKTIEDIFEDLVEDNELKDLSFLDIVAPHPDTHNPEQLEVSALPEDHE
jgi:hypothetical protein